MLELVLIWVLLIVLLGPAARACAWGRGHSLIREWAAERLPQWQRDALGQAALTELAGECTALQDTHAGGQSPHLDRYCVPPGARLSLHDVAPPEAAAAAIQWYIHQVGSHLRAGRKAEAMRYLGVLCHWNEDPGCPGAHNSPVTETVLRQILPPPPEKENLNYLFGYGGIADAGSYSLAPEAYRPRLLGASLPEAAARIHQHHRRLARRTSAYVVPLVQAVLRDDGAAADAARAAAALLTARHSADVLYTALCLATGRVDAGEAEAGARQPLTEWLSEFTGGPLVGHPYYVVPFLVNQGMDASRRLHPLRFAGDGTAADVAFGFGMGTPFALEYTLAPGGVFDRFTCRAGLHALAGAQGKVTFLVRVNGQPAFTSPPLPAGAPPIAVDVYLPSTPLVRLALETIPEEGTPSLHNLTVWGEPTLHRAAGGPAQAPPEV